jgi:hypothetical protein
MKQGLLVLLMKNYWVQVKRENTISDTSKIRDQKETRDRHREQVLPNKDKQEGLHPIMVIAG